MAVVRTIVTGCGAAVNFLDEGYSGAAEAELALRRDNMLKTAERLAREAALNRLRREKTERENTDEKQ